ncbi:hypothetical protein D3C73_965870 [compost metagenome]
MAAGERLDEAGSIITPLHGESSQLQTGNPAFCAGFKEPDIFSGKRQTHHPAQKFSSFGGVEPQVCSPKFSQLMPHPEPWQRQHRIFACGDDKMHLRRQVLYQKNNCLVNRSGIYHMVIVKDEHRGFRLSANFIQQCR